MRKYSTTSKTPALKVTQDKVQKHYQQNGIEVEILIMQSGLFQSVYITLFNVYHQIAEQVGDDLNSFCDDHCQ